MTLSDMSTYATTFCNTTAHRSRFASTAGLLDQQITASWLAPVCKLHCAIHTSGHEATPSLRLLAWPCGSCVPWCTLNPSHSVECLVKPGPARCQPDQADAAPALTETLEVIVEADVLSRLCAGRRCLRREADFDKRRNLLSCSHGRRCVLPARPPQQPHFVLEVRPD